MTDLDFDGRVAIVTGAGGGLGRAHALLLARRGARVVVNDVGASLSGDGEQDLTPAQSVIAEIEALGGEAVVNTDTVATAAGGEAITKTAIDAFGCVDIVVNNAGILRDKSFQKLSPDLLEPVLDVHLKGAFYVTRPAWEHMREQGYGRIVSTSSSSGLFGNFGQANYAAAKAGIVGLTRVLAIEGQRFGIAANAIAPIAVTRMTEAFLGEAGSKFTPESVAPVVAWLAHEDCSVTGEVYSVAANYVARIFTGVTDGIFETDLTPEIVRDRFEEIRDRSNYYVPITGDDIMREVHPRLL